MDAITFIPAALAIAIFIGTIFQSRPRLRATTKSERDKVAASARRWRIGASVTLVVLAPLVVAALHMSFQASSWMPRVMS